MRSREGGKDGMSGKWKKMIWAIFMIQLMGLHLYLSAGLLIDGRYRGRKICLVILFIWWAGAVLAGIGCYFSYRRFRAKCVPFIYRAEEDDPVYESYYAVCRQLNLKKRQISRIFYCDTIASPFVMGYGNSVLLMPKDVMKDEHAEFLLQHECTHMKHWDMWYKLFMLVFNCLLWYQPIAYLFRYLSYQDIEISCDESVVEGKSGEERLAYGNFLIEGLRRASDKNYAYFAFFFGTKRLMKNRISAVMEENRRWNLAAGIAVGILAAETLIAGGYLALAKYRDYGQATAPFNLYEGYAAPEFYTQDAIDSMAVLLPVDANAYYDVYWSVDRFEEKEFDEIGETEGPWQVKVKDPDRYMDCLTPLFWRFIYYYEDQLRGSEMDYQHYSYGGTLEILQWRLLAGDCNEAVFALVCREYVGEDYAELPQVKNGWARVSKDSYGYYAYYETAVHVRLFGPYIYELVGIADLWDTVFAYEERYPEADFSDITELMLTDEVSGEEAFEESSSATGYSVSTEGETVMFRAGEDSDWIVLPVEKSLLLDSGDPLAGTSSGIREESYQCDDIKQIFSYSDYDYATGEKTPITVVYYENGGWKTSVVSDQYVTTDELFITFPTADTGYLLAVTERVVFQQATVIFKTTDGGATWQELALKENEACHSLTMDFGFITEEIGFVSVYSSGTPCLLETLDGGESWQYADLSEAPEYYSIAHIPEAGEDGILLYVGMEGYAEDQGEKAYFISTDGGESWQYQKQVYRN